MINLANKYLLKYKTLLITVIIVSIFSSICDVVSPYILSNFIDSILINKDIQNLTNFIIIFSSLAILEIIFNYFSNISFAKLQSKSIFDFNVNLIKRTQKLPLKFFQDNTASYLTQRINHDAYTIISFLLRNYVNVICNLLLLITIICLLTKINFILFSIFCISIFIYLIIYKTFKKKLKIIAAKNIEIQNKYVSTQEAQFKNIKFIKINVLYKFLRKKLHQNFDSLFNIIIERTKIAYWFSTSSKIINHIFNICIIFIGSILVINDKMTVGNFIILNSYFKIGFSNIAYFLNLGSEYQECLASYERILEILNYPLLQNGEIKINNISKIKLENVNLEYNKKTILKNFNICFEKGNFYLITGNNGIGKTSLLYLITGIIPPTNGNIYINDTNMKDLNLDYFRKYYISFLEQEPTLLNDTIKTNLTTNIKYSKQRFKELIKYVGLNKIFKSNHNMRTIIDESLTNISGGEKQKISLVRTFLKDTPVILLDEPLSALDKKSIYQLKKLLLNAKKDKIIICITHKNGLEDIADKIIDFNKLHFL